MTIPSEIMDLLKLLVIPLCIWYFEWKTSKRDELRKQEEVARKKEQAKKDEMILRGLSTLSDCQYEVIYDLKNGEHNGGLDQCMEEIAKYRADVKGWIHERAAYTK